MAAPYYADEHATLHHGDCLEVLRTLPDASVDAVVTDPPYGLEFMGRDWDSFKPAAAKLRTRVDGRTNPADGKSTVTTPESYVAGAPFQVWCQQWATECLRVLKPGGHLLAFGGTRTWHRLTCAIEDAGFEIRDSIAWLYGSGFPKSHNLTGEHAGWGTALKPGHEPICVGRKPLAGTVAANVLEHGTGGLNIDGCRLGTDGGARRGPGDLTARGPANAVLGAGLDLGNAAPRVAGLGRWPANVALGHSGGCVEVGVRQVATGTAVNRNKRPGGTKPAEVYGAFKNGDQPDHTYGEGGMETVPDYRCVDGCPVRALDEQAGQFTSGRLAAHHRRAPKVEGILGAYGSAEGERGCGDTGGASRFFYVAKADRSERPRVNGVAHPTVKPLALMRWLCRLVTPPGGTVLEPFAGSGTTVEAALTGGFNCIAIEREADYLPLIMSRLAKPIQTGFNFEESA